MFRLGSLISATCATRQKASSWKYLGVATALPIAAAITICDEKRTSKEKTENISLYLKPESKAILTKFLADRGVEGKEPQFVCFSRNATKDHTYVYKPLYGQRAAFRLKGLVQTDSGIVVGVGKISTMVGEVKDDDYVASVPFFDAKEHPSSAVENTLLDIPTRLHNVRKEQSKPVWKGRLPSTHVRGASHDSLSGVTYVALPLNKQVVVEGYICSSKFADAQGSCLYDRSLDEEEMKILKESQDAKVTAAAELTTSPAPKEPVGPTASSNTEINTDSGGDSSKPTEPVAAKEECAVCRYMKAGPCRDEFIAWDDCVQGATEDDLHNKCFKRTCNMMRCMRNHEYYDIMSAGTDFARLEEVEKNSDALAVKSNA